MRRLKRLIKKLNYDLKPEDVIKLIGEPTETMFNQRNDLIYLYIEPVKGIRGWLYGDFSKISILFIDNRLANVRLAKSKTVVLDQE